jgi:drug/metabolite transporter (DMT)-like permease
LYGSLVGWYLFNESLNLHHAIGAALILPGIYLASQPPLDNTVRTEK